MATITCSVLDRTAEDNAISKAKITAIKTAQSALSTDEIISQVKRLEKRTFPKEEAMDFDLELKKRNTELIVVIDPSPPEDLIASAISEAYREPPKSLLSPTVPGSPKEKDSPASSSTITSSHTPKALVIAYLLHARSAGADLLHKVCVADKYRRQNIASQLLDNLKTKLESQGCERIQLWVDWKRDAAIELYKNAGFRRTDGARDYYGPGRHGVKMTLDLNWVW